MRSAGSPTICGDHRKLLAERTLDIVNIASRDHGHALPMIAAVAAGTYDNCEKPNILDGAKGQAMSAGEECSGRTM